MRLRLLRLRFRRRLREGQQQVEGLSQQAEQGLERHFFRRFGRLSQVRRFVTGWLLLLVVLIGGVGVQTFLLSGYYQSLRPVAGGIYNEGVLGTFTTANPLYATSDVDSTLSHLLFAGLLTYNQHNQLVGDLASGYTVDEKGTTYTVHIKPHLLWQDGQQLTRADVLFTYHAIQNPDAQSPLNNSWQGITVSAPDAQTVMFQLPDPLASFPYDLTNGIVPKHVLAGVPTVDLRSADFNTNHPIGAGPFAWHAIQIIGGDPNTAQEQIALTPFIGYQGGQPKLQEFVVHAYASRSQLVQALKTGQLTGAEGLGAIPSELQGKNWQAHSLLLTAATMVFYKTSTGVLSDPNVRQALIQGTDTDMIIKSLGYSTHAVREPFLTGQLGYSGQYAQAGFNVRAARSQLDQDGWVVGKNGLRSKDNQTLSFSLRATDTSESSTVTHMLQQQWAQLGVKLIVDLQNSADFQNSLTYHDYDALLYGISIGVDPDVFVYWDSSQADVRSANRLNLSEYKNPTADAALEAGRTRLSPDLRVVKYKPFLQAWQQDAPALGLYQPRLLYITNGPVSGLSEQQINTATDRFNNVQNWQIRQAKVSD